MDDSTEWPEVFAEDVSLGGVRPRCPAGLPGSVVSCPRSDTLCSEEDRSAGVGLFENNRRNASPTLEDRLGARVSSVWGKTIENLQSRTIPEDGKADNLSLTGEDLLNDSLGGGPPCS